MLLFQGNHPAHPILGVKSACYPLLWTPVCWALNELVVNIVNVLFTLASSMPQWLAKFVEQMNEKGPAQPQPVRWGAQALCGHPSFFSVW